MIPAELPLERAGRSDPYGTALIDNEKQLTYSDAVRRVRQIASGLRTQDVRIGDRVAILGDIDLEIVLAVHACWWCGAIPVPIDASVGGDRLQDQLEMISAEMKLASEPMSSNDASSIRVTVLEESGGDADAPPIQITANDTAVILFTSGTTGSPSMVPLTWKNLISSALASMLRLGHTPSDRWFMCLQPYHMGGFAPIVRTSVYGTGLVLGSPTPDSVREGICEHSATHISLVPTLLKRMIDASVPLDECGAVLVGGDRTPPSLVRTALNRDIPIYTSYGMTEASSQIATATPSDLTESPGTVGRPLQWTDVSIRGDDTGELVVRGPTVSSGYLGDGPTERFTSDGALLTGDIGSIDEKGRVYVTGRTADRIVSGGETVNARHIRSILEAHPQVRAAAVVGIPDETWGQTVGAAIVADTSVDAILESLDPELTAAERPRVTCNLDEMPRTESGTIDRSEVRTLLEE